MQRAGNELGILKGRWKEDQRDLELQGVEQVVELIWQKRHDVGGPDPQRD